RYAGQERTYEPNGHLVLSVLTGEFSGLRRRWSDSAKHTLESQLPKAVRGLLDIGAHLHQQTVKREEAHRRQMEEEGRQRAAARRRQVYDQRHKALSGQIEVIDEAARLRGFLERVQDRFRSAGVPVDENVRRWIAWTERRVAWLDARGLEFPEFG